MTHNEPRARVFIGPAGSEIVGYAEDGTPVVADEDGVGAMTEIKNVTVTGFSIGESE